MFQQVIFWCPESHEHRLQFVEDTGDIVFYKDAHGLAATRPKYSDVDDSGVEVDKDSTSD